MIMTYEMCATKLFAFEQRGAIEAFGALRRTGEDAAMFEIRYKSYRAASLNRFSEAVTRTREAMADRPRVRLRLGAMALTMVAHSSRVWTRLHV